MTNALVERRGGAPSSELAKLDAAMPAFQEALPAHVTPARFRRVAGNAILSTPDLQRCYQRKPKAVLSALLSCATDGLMPDGREAVLIAYKDQVTYIPMIRGVINRMYQSGEVKMVRSEVVYRNDTFELELGDSPSVTHFPALDARGERRGAYAVIELANGEVYPEYMSREDIEEVKASVRGNKGPWHGPFEGEMWRKTVIKRAAKYCPISSELQALLDRDNELYDPDKTIDAPSPARERFKSLRAEPERRTYDEPLLIDEPAAEVDEKPPVDVSAEPEPEQPAKPASKPRKARSAPVDPTEVMKLFRDTLAAIEGAKDGEQAAAALDKAMGHPLAPHLGDKLRDQLSEALFQKDMQK